MRLGAVSAPDHPKTKEAARDETIEGTIEATIEKTMKEAQQCSPSDTSTR